MASQYGDEIAAKVERIYADALNAPVECSGRLEFGHQRHRPSHFG